VLQKNVSRKREKRREEDEERGRRGGRRERGQTYHQQLLHCGSNNQFLLDAAD